MSSEATMRMLLLGEDRSASKALMNAGSTAEKTKGHFSSLGRIAAGVFAGGALAEGARKAGEFLKSSVTAAIDDEAAQRKLGIALRNTTGANKEQVVAVSDWLTKQSEAYGVSKDDLMPAFQRLAESTGSVTKAQKELTLAQNVSAGTGKDLATVSAAFMKANNGTTSSLARLGLKTKDAQGNTLSLKAAMKGMADTFHGQAEARAHSLQGQMDRLHATWHETEVQVGQRLIPVLVALGDWFFSKGLPAIERTAGMMGGQFHAAFDSAKPVIDKVTAGLESLSTPFHAVMGFLQKNPATVKAFVATLVVLVAVIGLVTAATAAWTAVLAVNPITLFVIALAALVAGLVYAYKHSEKFREVVQTTLAVVKAVVTGFIAVVHGAWQKWGNDLLAIGRAVFGAIAGVIKGELQIIVGIFKVFSGLIHGNWSQVWTGLKDIVSGAWQVIRSEVKLGAQAVVGLVKAIPGMLGGLAGMFANAGKALVHAIFNGILGAARAGAGFVASLVSDLKAAINSALHLPLQVNFDKGPVHIHATVIPALARGGITTGPTLAMIGDNPGGREAVIPLPAGGLSGLGGDGTVANLTVVLKAANGREMQRELLELKRVNGNLALGLA